MQRFVTTIVFVCVLLMLPPASAGEIYKCRDAGGSLTFSDQPCGDDAEKVEIEVRRGPGAGKAGTANDAVSDAPAAASTETAPVGSGKRYYDPVVRTYAPSSSIINETGYYLEFRDMQSAKAGIDTERLEQEEGVKYLYYTGAYPTCRSELDAYFARGEASDREIDKKGQEKECTAGQRLEQGFKWHCYVDESQSEEKGCDVMACWTHYVCQ